MTGTSNLVDEKIAGKVTDISIGGWQTVSSGDNAPSDGFVYGEITPSNQNPAMARMVIGGRYASIWTDKGIVGGVTVPVAQGENMTIAVTSGTGTALIRFRPLTITK